ncbi:hypothetical protein CcaverHIS002_0600600 [Cutaneotrichosporon cavernicola]|uniref:Protein CPL1-like domain-containing protein n=1 Tax=Cutaneotrichosporon cavernicola TaxID=279322 RepID=A0AA48L5P8_9TREE|nr:uncharacterized protein CcaverHIS019_0500690 [Cutaneotrichosporon cavernicola]BEI85773.1 hypothetical protein CcaverHIS002_0600600 [Cutaneotrichosporon cavernicola]BEI92441.1 hypothetical protein CcaverHIS019_0500690 [Cutaneotrichosporon cavernicola]BEJ00214.1 hypothetical protein CcaverHIS631_0500710 [Cutaneotrichosporon cavernicola]BEJ07985.1 hypothetical protein CcaverHIS641_0500700 [Cutaneotrichosporon cavernicola]
MLALALLLLPLIRALCIDPESVHAASPRLARITASSQADCTATCGRAGNPYAYYTPGSCFCAKHTVDSGEAISAPDCGGSYSLTHTHIPSDKVMSACPSGQMQCNTTPGKWACVEINSTVSSCGGCVTGHYAMPESTSGEDCTTAPGVVASSATCVLGQCQAAACIPGWSLRNDVCIYNVYGSVLRGTLKEQEWVVKHLAQYAPEEEEEEEEKQFLDEAEVRALIAEVQANRSKTGEPPLPVQVKAAAMLGIVPTVPQVPKLAESADEETPGAVDVEVKALRVMDDTVDTADDDTLAVKKTAHKTPSVIGLDTADEETPR